MTKEQDITHKEKIVESKELVKVKYIGPVQTVVFGIGEISPNEILELDIEQAKTLTINKLFTVIK